MALTLKIIDKSEIDILEIPHDDTVMLSVKSINKSFLIFLANVIFVTFNNKYMQNY